MGINKLSTRVWQDPIYFLAFGFGSGLMPFAPGTWGTIAAFPVYLLIAYQPWSAYLCLTVLAFILGVYFCDKVSRDLGVHDYSGIVWDEIVGYMFTMFLVPPTPVLMLGGFILFRIFDIWKPQPIGYIDMHVKGGLGIMLDDLLAAIPAWICLQILIWCFS
jgi:phosphatidylglycerophosphatase A